MNKIEFRILRESLHLSQTELSHLWNVNLRTIQSWEQGRQPIPHDRADKLIELDKMVDAQAEQFERALINARKEYGAPDEIVLIAYSQQSYDRGLKHFKLHNCLLARCIQRCKAIGINYKIVMFDRNAYTDWLDGQVDTSGKRSEWASLPT